GLSASQGRALLGPPPLPMPGVTMDLNQFSLDWLLRPIEPGTFFSDYWEQRPLTLFRDDPAYFRRVLSLEDIDHVLSSNDLKYPAIQLVKNSVPIPVPQYTTEGDVKGVSAGLSIELVKLFAEYQRGATITLNNLERSWLPLAGLCASMERLFSH